MVTVHGVPAFIDDKAWLISHLREMTNIHEADQAAPWKIEDAPEEFIQKLAGAIIGVEIPILRIEGKWKTSQNRPHNDKIGVVAGLLDKGDDEAVAMAALVRQHIIA